MRFACSYFVYIGLYMMCASCVHAQIVWVAHCLYIKPCMTTGAPSGDTMYFGNVM